LPRRQLRPRRQTPESRGGGPGSGGEGLAERAQGLPPSQGRPRRGGVVGRRGGHEPRLPQGRRPGRGRVVRRGPLQNRRGGILFSVSKPKSCTVVVITNLRACHSSSVGFSSWQMWYALSKTLAEREALAHAEKTGLDVVTVCPPLVLGPLLQRVANTSSLVLINLLKGDRDTVEDKARNAVDVRDLADAFVLAYETPEASGRYICGAYRKKLSEMAGIVESFCPDLARPVKFVEGEDDRMMSSKKLQALGWKFRAVEECLRDSVESYKAAGLLE
uniref:NAD-dependent epimerase/dehydratase domain-containing protein n=1 Tax=Aegilops tauschii subsp. strangulata TaxID=200361 RepID=A0A453SK66_AEGTS